MNMTRILVFRMKKICVKKFLEIRNRLEIRWNKLPMIWMVKSGKNVLVTHPSTNDTELIMVTKVSPAIIFSGRLK